MSISAQHTAILSITYAETFHLAGAQIPGIEGLANHATIFPIDLKALVPVHAHCHRQILQPQTSNRPQTFRRAWPAHAQSLHPESALYRRGGWHGSINSSVAYRPSDCLPVA